MRIIVLVLLNLFIIGAWATTPPPPPSTTQNNTNQSGSFGTLVQQNTSQAQQTFQNVNYKTLSGNQDQNDFMDDDDNSDVSLLSNQFKLNQGD